MAREKKNKYSASPNYKQTTDRHDDDVWNIEKKWNGNKLIPRRENEQRNDVNKKVECNT